MKTKKQPQRQPQPLQRKESAASNASPLQQRRPTVGAGTGAWEERPGMWSHQAALRVLRLRQEQGLPPEPAKPALQPVGIGPLGVMAL